MIQLKNINKRFSLYDRETILYENLNFEIQSGDFISIIGRSGSGKTTLLNMIAGLVDFNDGELIVDNIKYSGMSQDYLTKFRGKNMSFIFQQFHLIPNLTVRENIELPIDINGIKPRFTPIEILKKVGLLDKADSYPFNLSGGEQQRVAIARAFIGETSILMADEPTGNIDEKNAENIMKLLISLHRETKNTIILITHDKKVANYANKIYELVNNKLELIKDV